MKIESIAGYDVHPAASLYPLMDGAEYALFVADIQKHGQRERARLWTDGTGKIWLLDGRNRARACEDLGIELETETAPDGDPLDYIDSVNSHRRHLTTSQRAMIAAGLTGMRLPAGPSEIPTPELNGSNGDGLQAGRIDLPSAPVTLADAARRQSVSRRSVVTAKRVSARSPKLAEQVRDGKVSVSAAAVKISKADQMRAMREADAGGASVTHRQDVEDAGTWKRIRSLSRSLHAALVDSQLADGASPFAVHEDRIERMLRAAWKVEAETDLILGTAASRAVGEALILIAKVGARLGKEFASETADRSSAKRTKKGRR